jgi:microsomal dipeptidase-like Zn-dependent dipeptidase
VSRTVLIACAVALGAVSVAGPAAAAPRPSAPLANRCVTLAAGGGRFVVSTASGYRLGSRARRRALRFYLKPTGLGTYLLYDAGAQLMTAATGSEVARGAAPVAAAEWGVSRRSRGRYAIRSTAANRVLAVAPRTRALVTRTGSRGALFRVGRRPGCRAYPEAGLGARGRTSSGTRRDASLIGFADAHVHVTADLRAGGQVISGEGFDRFGITEALGHDADVHGPDGSLDVTGNLLRGGSSGGTHDTHGWPTFAGWPTFDTYTHQQIYYRWLERSWLDGLRLIVAQTVEDQPLCNIEPRRSHSCDETASIELQVKRLRALQDYVDAQSGGRGRGWFRLVYSPGAARRVIARGKLAVVIGVESSNPFGCSEFEGRPQCDRAAVDRGIARMRALGVRTMFLAHWVDNALAGAALEEGDKGSFIAAMEVAQTGHSFQTGSCPHPDQGVNPAGAVPDPLGAAVPAGRVCNTKGLTDLGAYAVKRMIANHMLIEADHLSEWARDQVLTIAEQQHYPLVSSHTGTGGVWDPSELRRLYAGGGFASATIDDAAKLPGKILAFRRYSRSRFPGVGLGTDTGGFNALPGPSTDARQAPLHYPFRSFLCNVSFQRERTGQKTFDINKDGVAHYGLLPDLLADVQRQKRGKQALGLLARSAGAYVGTWQLAMQHK